jgi:hypothetical protein
MMCSSKHIGVRNTSHVQTALDFPSCTFISMDAILGYRPLNRAAIIEMDRHVLESARSAFVRAYQEFGLLNTVLDAAALGGMRAVTHPFDLDHIM